MSMWRFLCFSTLSFTLWSLWDIFQMIFLPYLWHKRNICDFHLPQGSCVCCSQCIGWDTSSILNKWRELMMIGMSGDLSPQVCTLQCSETILDKWSNCVLEARMRPTWGSVAQGGSSSQGMVQINNSFPFISLIQLHMNQPICYENRVQWIRSPHFCKNSLGAQRRSI